MPVASQAVQPVAQAHVPSLFGGKPVVHCVQPAVGLQNPATQLLQVVQLPPLMENVGFPLMSCLQAAQSATNPSV